MPDRPRLQDLRPQVAAREAFDALAESAHTKARGLGMEMVALRLPTESPVYLAALELASFAQGTTPLADEWTPERALDVLVPLFPAEQLLQPEPETSLALAIAGAFARAHLERGQHLTIPELAVLTGIDRHYVRKLSAAGDVPGAYRSEANGHRPWMFRPSKALRTWILAQW